METAKLHPAEQDRLDALERLGLLDTPAEERFDRIIRLAAAVLDMPIALFSLIDRDRQWFKSRLGLDEVETPRDVAFCAHAIVDETSATMVVPDAALDTRFFDNPFVTQDPNIRFYAGQVVNSREGMPLGTLCVIDRTPRTLTDAQLALLADLGAMVEDELARQEYQELEAALRASEARFRHLFQHANDIITVIDANGGVLYSSPSRERVLGYPDDWYHPQGILGIVHPDDLPGALGELQRLIERTRGPEPFTVRVRAHSGEWRHLECVGANLLDEPAVRGVVLTSRDTTERERLTAQLEHLASHDPLTDLPNRSILEPELERALARTTREGIRVGLCFIDLDGFKAVNDSHGHAVGDDVIVEVAERIRSIVRGGDTALRMGGDEFVVVLDPITNAADAIDAATRIRDAITVPPIVRGDHPVGASVGVAMNEPGERPGSLLIRADTALYRAKELRRSAVVLAAEWEPVTR